MKLHYFHEPSQEPVKVNWLVFFSWFMSWVLPRGYCKLRKINKARFFQRLNQSTNVQLETQRLTRTATLQGTETAADRKQDPDKKKTASKVSSRVPYLHVSFDNFSASNAHSSDELLT